MKIWMTTDKKGQVRYLTEKQAVELMFHGKKEFKDFKLIASSDWT